jgi:Leucine-rich repeat (LRR) protein
VRLTKTNFPFVDQLDLEERTMVVKYLQGARSVAAMYDTDVNNAKASLEARGLSVYVHALTSTARIHVMKKVGGRPCNPTSVVALPELSVWSFHHSVASIVCNYTVHKLGDFSCFPFLKHLGIERPGSVREANFKNLAPCKLLRSLRLNLGGATSTLEGVGELVNLIELVIDANAYQAETRCSISTDVGKLSNLNVLQISGHNFSGRIPTEIGLLTSLHTLHFHHTDLSGAIPTELGLLSHLKYLSILYSPELYGSVHLPGCHVSCDKDANILVV